MCFIRLCYLCPPHNRTRTHSRSQQHLECFESGESCSTHTPSIFPYRPYTNSMGYHPFPSIHSSIHPHHHALRKDTHAEIHKAANWYICVCAEGESFRNRNTCTETQTKSQNKTRNYAVRSSRAGLLDIRQYKMGIILFVVAMSRPDTNASMGIVRKTGTNSSSSKWYII
jgi:hypothetical protein